jgi:GT2 family glycosyltransferase
VRYGWEDVDLGLRLRQAGLGRVKARAAYVLHDRSRRPLEAEARDHEECGINAARYLAKHPSPASRRRVRLRTLWMNRAACRLGFTPDRLRWLAAERDGRLRSRAARAVFLMGRYADGLRQGLAHSVTSPDGGE